MVAKLFLSTGDLLINPALVTYAAVETDSEGMRLRLGFAGQPTGAPSEIRLSGLEARSILRWLRSNAEYLDAGSNGLQGSRIAGTRSTAVEVMESPDGLVIQGRREF